MYIKHWDRWRNNKMYSFRNDYSEGAHPNILETLLRTNTEQTLGYGEDAYTQKAQTLIKQQTHQKPQISQICKRKLTMLLQEQPLILKAIILSQRQFQLISPLQLTVMVMSLTLQVSVEFFTAFRIM